MRLRDAITAPVAAKSEQMTKNCQGRDRLRRVGRTGLGRGRHTAGPASRGRRSVEVAELIVETRFEIG